MMWINWSVTNNSNPPVSYIKNFITLNYPCTDNTACEPYVIDLAEGVYRVKLCGAQGGSAWPISGHNGTGGEGGCSSGILDIGEPQRFYLYIGGHGTDYKAYMHIGGFNGGGDAYGAGAGGGASDLRLKLKEEEGSIESRLIIAGGGGGCNDDEDGPPGGGLIGGKTEYSAGGGTQTEGGTGRVHGSLGQGGGSNRDGGGGGGGYWGGGQGSGGQCPGGGGSSYVSGHPNCVDHPSGIKFYHAIMKQGGNKGDGFAEIRRLWRWTDRQPLRKQIRCVVIVKSMVLLLINNIF